MFFMNIGQDRETRMAFLKDLPLKNDFSENIPSTSSETDSHDVESEIDPTNITIADKKSLGKLSARSSANPSPKPTGKRSPPSLSKTTTAAAPAAVAAATALKLENINTHPSQNSQNQTRNVGSDGELRYFDTVKPRRESSASSPSQRLISSSPGEYNAAYLKEALIKLRSAVGEKQGNFSPRTAPDDRTRKPTCTDAADSQLPPLQPPVLCIESVGDSIENEDNKLGNDIEQLNFLPIRYITTSPSISPSTTPPHPYTHDGDSTGEAVGQLGDLSNTSNSLATVPLSPHDEQEPICPALVLQPPTPADLTRIMALMGSNLLTVGSIVGHQAADVAVVMGAAVAVQAERVLTNTSEIVPRYSNQDMKRVITRKNALLGELSESCLQLGIMQDKEKEMASLIQELNTKEADLQERQLSEHYRANVLESELKGLREDVKNEEQRREALRGQLEAMRLELITERYVAESLRATLDEAQVAAAAQAVRLAQVSESEQRTKWLLETSREERARDVAAVQSELQQMSIDSMTLRDDMRLASEQAVAQITGTYLHT
jgi:hypothetical protein